MKSIPIEPGTMFGRLTVLREVRNGKPGLQYACRCSCGAEGVWPGRHLRNGNTSSCGCLQRELVSERMAGHRSVGTPEHQTWRAMRERCGNPRNKSWPYYGGRGIIVCDRWRQSFEAFAEDMGERPEGMTLDRIDPNGNYEPGNCRWATWQEQRHNRRKAA